jgi:DNA modification methylase
MGWRKGDQPEHDGTHAHDSVWEVDFEGKARSTKEGHPCAKPVELFLRPIKKHTKPSDIVFEPFSGSGSQIIAAERSGRHCRALEISPPFVDVAIKRWEKATGQQATLEDGGTFADVATERGVA